jgi:hypothetical protein
MYFLGLWKQVWHFESGHYVYFQISNFSFIAIILFHSLRTLQFEGGFPPKLM